mmetsp:Transcript_7267/g.7121  ORF Transcript_7267/g.7121 Transcript_7267/m.7121 type:complete len:226 (+) Transcript_7267:110-787(+)
MKLLLISSFYNIALVAVTTFLVVVVLLPQESFAFRQNNDVYHIPLNHGDFVVRTLQFRGGSIQIDIIKPIDNDNDDDGDGDPITNIAGITMDDSFRGGGQYQRQHYSTATTLRTGGFVKQPNNLARKLRRLHDMRCTVNKAWSQVTKGCSLRVPTSNRNPRHTDAQLAVQVRGGADNDKKDQNHKVVNDSTKGIKRTAADVFYSLLTSLLFVALGFCLGKIEGTW